MVTHPTKSRAARKLGLVLLALAVAGVGLFATVTWLEGSDGCADSSARQRQIAALKVLGTPPAGSRPALGIEGVQTECMDDSGDPWLAATSGYGSDADQQTVLDHYRKVTKQDGWTSLRPEVDAGGAQGAPADSCYSKDIAGGPVLLRIHYATLTEYLVSVESSLDGTLIEC
ncbi:hypothetical protein ABT034_15780 [Streptomyces sp. NPDC002773]|uniref:hypothetical protein n=1 Tax=Streptomyces sp. NPDC002773 TaxID=3154430 RepID=UPI003320015E